MTCLVFFGHDFYQSSSGSESESESGGRGQSQPVALKFMKKREHYESELTTRYGPQREDGTWDLGEPLFKPEFVVSLRDHFVIDKDKRSQSPVFLYFQQKKQEEMKGKAEDRLLLPRRSSIVARTAEHEFCIVMPQMLRNLQEAITSLNIAGNPQKLPDVMKIMYDVAQCLQHVHSKDYIHADVKPKNIAYDPKLQKWLLIDCDAMVELDEPVGAKHSSAYNPPEFIAKSENNQYFLRVPGSEIAVATSPVTAKLAWDVWGFGAVLCELCSGEPLFPKDHFDEVVRRQLRKLFKCREEAGKVSILMPKMEQMDKIGDDSAIDLASFCFKLSPKSEAVSMRKVLKHYFFSKEQKQVEVPELKEMLAIMKRVDERTTKIYNMQLATRGDIAKYSGRLHRAIQAATDDQFPSAFVLLPPPPPPIKEQQTETRAAMMKKVR